MLARKKNWIVSFASKTLLNVETTTCNTNWLRLVIEASNRQTPQVQEQLGAHGSWNANLPVYTHYLTRSTDGFPSLFYIAYFDHQVWN